jgi:hypothetical protein
MDEMIKEFRKMIAEWLLHLSLIIMPYSSEKLDISKALLSYAKKQVKKGAKKGG